MLPSSYYFSLVQLVVIINANNIIIHKSRGDRDIDISNIQCTVYKYDLYFCFIHSNLFSKPINQ